MIVNNNEYSMIVNNNEYSAIGNNNEYSVIGNNNELLHLMLFKSLSGIVVSSTSGARCSSVVRAFAHGAMGHRINHS